MKIGFEHSPMNELNLKFISNYLQARQETIAVAESVTSGYIQLMLSTADEAMKFYQGGITAYNVAQKVRHLSVDPIQGTKYNCVSEQVAQEMAIGVADKFQSDWGVSITGYAAPVPEAGVFKLFSFYSFAYKGKCISTSLLLCGQKSQKDAQYYYATMVIQNLKNYLSNVVARVDA